jgi:hypothetical protein
MFTIVGPETTVPAPPHDPLEYPVTLTTLGRSFARVLTSTFTYICGVLNSMQMHSGDPPPGHALVTRARAGEEVPSTLSTCAPRPVGQSAENAEKCTPLPTHVGAEPGQDVLYG